jgi:quercetin dioxygenase-like cupin family protein
MGLSVISLRSGLVAAIGFCLVSVQTGIAQQQPLKRTELLKTSLTDLGDKEMHVWIGEVAPGAATGRHIHPTPRFVYVLEGAVVLEIEGQPPQTFKAGQAFVERPDVVHNFKNASTSEPAKALGFQYAGTGQPLQAAAP